AGLVGQLGARVLRGEPEARAGELLAPTDEVGVLTDRCLGRADRPLGSSAAVPCLRHQSSSSASASAGSASGSSIAPSPSSLSYGLGGISSNAMMSSPSSSS